GARRGGSGVADFDRVGAIVLLGEIDQFTVVRLAQELLHLGRLDGLGVALDLGHGFAQLFGAPRTGVTPRASQSLLDDSSGARDGAAALFRSGPVRRRGLHASFLLAAAPPSPSRSAAAPAAAPAAAFRALASPIRYGHARWLGRGARDA